MECITYDGRHRQILLFVVFFIVTFIIVMTKIRLQRNESSISNSLFWSNTSNFSYCRYVVKPFFHFICDKTSLNSIQLSTDTKKHVCYQLYSKSEKADLFSHVHMDFEPFKKSKILFTDIENMSNSCRNCHHIQIIQNKLYHVPRDTAFNYETRSRSVTLLIKHMMDTFSDIPDLDLFFNVQDIVDLQKELNNVLFKVPVFAFTKTLTAKRGLRPDAIVLMPCFTFWSWPEVPVGRWTRTSQSILNAAHKIEYEKRMPKLFWRGVDNWKRSWYINMTKQYPDIVDIAVMKWNKAKDGLSYTGSDTYTTLEKHCNYKYLAHLEGNSYSSRLKYLLLCGSPVMYNPLEHWKEYWHHLLKNGKNIIFFEAGDNQMAFDSTLNFLRHDDNIVKEIGKQGQQIVEEYLNEHAVSCYWWKLLHEYGKLLGYKPTLHSDAVYIDDFILTNSA